MKFKLYKKRRLFTSEDLKNELVALSRANQSYVLVGSDRDRLEEIVYELKKGRLDRFKILQRWLKDADITPPFELLWVLHNEGIMYITSYLSYHDDYCYIVNTIMSRAIAGEFDENEKPFQPALAHLLNSLLAIRGTPEFKDVSENIIHSTVHEAVRLAGSASIHWNYINEMYNLDVGYHETQLKEFARLHLEKFLNCDSENLDLPFVIEHHTKLWSYGKLEKNLRDFLEKFISTLDPTTVMAELTVAINREYVNWKYLLFIVSIFCRTKKNAILLKGGINVWLNNAYTERNTFILFSALIVARHCCNEKATHFKNYPTWLSSISFKEVEFFRFFYKCLAEIVPHEPPLYLKIHANKVPSAPASCQSLINDYVTLIKTKLSDLNESIDYIGLFNDIHETDEVGREADVKRAISIFQETNEIPKLLLEAAVFRRQYYEKTFLKMLLSVAAVEDPVRARLIKKLYSAGKIPSAMYRSWSALSL